MKMNIDICEICKKHCLLFMNSTNYIFFINDNSHKLSDELQIDFYRYYVDSKYIFEHKINSIMKCIKGKNINLSNIKVSNECPYKIEHDLNDWNNK